MRLITQQETVQVVEQIMKELFWDDIRSYLTAPSSCYRFDHFLQAIEEDKPIRFLLPGVLIWCDTCVKDELYTRSLIKCCERDECRFFLWDSIFSLPRTSEVSKDSEYCVILLAQQDLNHSISIIRQLLQEARIVLERSE